MANEYTLKISRKSSLLSTVIELDINDDQLVAVLTRLSISKIDEETSRKILSILYEMAKPEITKGHE